MAKGFKHGAGGGGAGLNFKIVGNPQPENPKENTIWIDTDIPITSWIFSATQPEAAAEGMVWFSTGTSSSIEFNALKENVIQVYPLSTKQYVGGAWVDKSAKSYQGGVWVDWIAYMYDSGEEYTVLTGGWAISGTGTKGTTSITAGSTSAVKASNHYAYHKNTINLDNINTIFVHVVKAAVMNTSAGSCRIDIVNSSGTVAAKTIITTTENAVVSEKDFSVDVSALTGAHTVRVCAQNSSGSGDRVVYTQFNKVWGKI